MAGLTVARESVRSEDAARLIALLSAELAERYHEDADDGSGDFRPEDAEGDGAAFAVARLDGEAVGCGALRPLEEGVGEIKRVFVLPEVRGRRIAQRILIALEEAARESGYRAVRLETGTRQPESIALYERMGYHRIAPYGYYADHPLSVCFEKRLTL